MKKRVYELAREYGMKGADLVKTLKALGYTKVKTHMAVLDDADLIQVQALLEINGKIPEKQVDVPEVPLEERAEFRGLVRKKKKKVLGSPAEESTSETETTTAVEDDVENEEPSAAEPVSAEAPILETVETTDEESSETVDDEEVIAATPIAEDAETVSEIPEQEEEWDEEPIEATSEPSEEEHPIETTAKTEVPSGIEDEAESTEPVAVPAGSAPLDDPEVSVTAEETDEEGRGEAEESRDSAPAPEPTTPRPKAVPMPPRPSRPRRQANILGRIDLSQVSPRRPQPPQSEPHPSRPAAAGRSAPTPPRPTLGRDRKVVRGAGPREEMTQQQLRDREQSRVRYRSKSQRGGGGRRSHPSESDLAASRPDSAVIEPPINPKTLSQAIGVKVGELVFKLLQVTGSPYTPNTTLDEETAVLIADEFGVTLEVKTEELAEDVLIRELQEAHETSTDTRVGRPPVIAFLGHVDHGKTSLLDYIRRSNVTQGEAGGITQHIGAYQVVTSNGSQLTILDTPGHEAFTAMRARGANTTDIVVLVVAADDGVMPQTEEAINHARAAKVPIVVALNKADKPEANVMRAKQQLAGLGLQSEDWGGQVQVVETSAISGMGIDSLLEAVALEAELLELSSNPDAPARGVVLEAEISEGRGIIAHLLIQDGTLKSGDVILAGEGYGRVRALYDDRGEVVDHAGPSTPVEVIGLSALPHAGDTFYVVQSLAKAKDVGEERAHKAREISLAERSGPRRTLQDILGGADGEQKKELRIVMRADVQGSLEALKKSLSELSTEAISVELLQSGVGAITENDINLANASDAVVLGFHVTADEKARVAAEKSGIEIRSYQVIYELLDDVKAAMEDRLSPIVKETVVGTLEIRELFSFSKVGKIAGCFVTSGQVKRANPIRLVRDGLIVYTGRLASLRRHKDDVREVKEGFECGITLESFQDLKPGDVVESYVIEHERRKL